jgi:hypothetical protein
VDRSFTRLQVLAFFVAVVDTLPFCMVQLDGGWGGHIWKRIQVFWARGRLGF